MFKSIKNLIVNVPKKLLVVPLVLSVLLGATVATGAWSPERPTYTIQNPAPHVTFDSITDNPNYGDERTFFDAKPASDTSLGGFNDKNTVTDGQEMLLRIYVHNNAADNLNESGKGIAHDAKARIWLPEVTADTMRANAYISASNAAPVEVADTTDLIGGDKFNVAYVPGSATMYTNAVPAGYKLSDTIVGNGAPIGYTGPNGDIPGCFKYTGIITIKVKVKMETPDFTVEKTVSKDKKTDADKYSWGKSINASPKEVVAYQLRFSNVGNTQLDGAILRDQLPKGFNIVPGTTVAKYGTDAGVEPVGNDAIVSNGGIDIGSYAPESGAVVMFKATAPNEDELNCGVNTLVNIAEARVDGQFTTDSANVVIDKTCENASPSYSCDLLELNVIDTKKVKFSVTTSQADGAEFKDVTFTFGDNTATAVTSEKTAEHQYDQDGTYVITAVPSFMVDGKLVTAESQACIKQITFKNDEPVVPSTPDTPATMLPNTGAGELLGLFMGVSVAGALAYRFWIIRNQ
jgi:uncharacterized repeat protein (TIGR01451 family)